MSSVLWLVFFAAVEGLLPGGQIPMKNSAANDLFAQQRFDEARSAYEEALEVDPKNGAVAYNLANTYAELGMMEEANELYRKAIKSKHSEAAALSRYNLGNLLMEQQNVQEAVDQYVDYLSQNPDDVDAKRNLQMALQQMQQQQQQQENQDDQENQDEQQQQQQQQSGGEQNDQQEQEQQQSQGEQDEQQEQEQQQQQSQSEQDEQQEQEQQQNQQQEQEQQDQGEQEEQQNQQQQQAQGEENQEKMSEQLKEQILEALRQQELQTQKEHQQRKIGPVRKRSKDW